MPDFRIADTAPEHPKLRAAGLAAAGLWAMAGAYSMGDGQLTDGWVPDYWVQTWQSGRRLAARLVEVGLWKPERRGGIPGWQFHDWLDIQRAAGQIRTERAKAAERARRARTSQRTYTARNSGRTSERLPHVTADVRSASHDSPSPSLSSGSVGGESSGSRRAGARNAPPKKPLISENRPDDRCPQHTGTNHDAPCRACMTSRKLATQWDHEQHHAAAKAASETAHATAQLRELAIDNCPLGCRQRGGYRPGGQPCDHDPQLEDRTRRGVAAVKTALAQARATRPPSDVAEEAAT